ncbi:response regulator [Roseomonas sp. GCM10028921]
MSQVEGLLASRRILLVEDEYLIAEAMEAWLRQAGAVVIGPVPRVEQALALIESEAEALDGAVLDVNLGQGETAYSVANRLNEICVPYLFATGDVRITGDRAHSGRPCLGKPISRGQLLDAVEKLLTVR